MDSHAVQEENLMGILDTMRRSPPTIAGLNSMPLGTPLTDITSQPTMVEERQITIAIGGNPAATISSLSSALAAAQASVTVLAQQNQQLQIASVSAVASVQAAAQLSAFSVLASVSSSAAVALASASAMVTNANAMALEAMRSADAARMNASAIQAQADLQTSIDHTHFSEAQVAIAIVVSIIGTLILALIGFFCFIRYRDRREKRRVRELRAAIKRADSGSSTGSGDIMWDERFIGTQARRPERSRSTRFEGTPRSAGAERLRGPPRIPVPRLPETIFEEKQTDWPISVQSTLPAQASPTPPSSGPSWSLFPKVSETDLRSQYSPRQRLGERPVDRPGDRLGDY